MGDMIWHCVILYGQKVSRDRKFAKFRGFKFREFYFLNKIDGKRFRDFLKIFIFNGIAFANRKTNKISFKIFFLFNHIFFSYQSKNRLHHNGKMKNKMIQTCSSHSKSS